jgi:hypothetical protein
VQPLAVAKAVRAPWVTLPRFSPHGPIVFFEARPLLLVASSLRLHAFGNASPTAQILIGLEGIAIVMAFLVLAWRMIEASDRETRLGRLTSARHLGLGGDIFFRILLFTLPISAAALVFYPLGQDAFYIVLGIDGITFLQITGVMPIWNSFLAAVIFMMMLNNEKRGGCSLVKAIGALVINILWIGPAIVIVAACLISLDFIQDPLQRWISLYVQTAETTAPFKNFVMLIYLFGFAVVRLWATVGILTFALRKFNERKRLREEVSRTLT